MLADIFASEWLSGRWLPSGYPAPVTTPGDTLKDIFGNTISVGSMVKLIGTVTAMNPMDPHFQDITIKPYFPQSVFVTNEAGVFPQNQPSATFQAHPLQLMVVGTSF